MSLFKTIYDRLVCKNIIEYDGFTNFYFTSNVPLYPKHVHYRNIQASPIYPDTQKAVLFKSLFAVQQVVHSFNRFVCLYRFKHAIPRITTDLLGLNEISVTHRSSFPVIQEGNLYWFTLFDFGKLIFSALTYSSQNFFASPIATRNPYNNMIFNKSVLYNFYFQCLFSGHPIHELIQKFFECHFHLSQFAYQYDYLIRDYLIQNYCKNTEPNVIMYHIELMLTWYHQQVPAVYSIRFHNEFPKEAIVKAMQPYLVLFLRMQYSFVNTTKSNAFSLLKFKLFTFKELNPSFGRKIFKPDNMRKYRPVFVTEVNRVIEDNKGFRNTHLRYIPLSYDLNLDFNLQDDALVFTRRNQTPEQSTDSSEEEEEEEEQEEEPRNYFATGEEEDVDADEEEEEDT